jgi:hypothetical protein
VAKGSHHDDDAAAMGVGHPRRVDRRFDLHVGRGDRKLLHDRSLLALRANSAFAAAVDRLGAVEARDLLRYLSSELNRLYFQLWNGAQIVLGALALWLLSGSTARPWAATRSAKWGIAAMLAIVVLMLVYLTPQIVTLGRSLDFVPRDPRRRACRVSGSSTPRTRRWRCSNSSSPFWSRRRLRNNVMPGSPTPPPTPPDEPRPARSACEDWSA